MGRTGKGLLAVLIALLGWAATASHPALLAQSRSEQQKYKESIRSAQRAEALGYVLAGAGIVLVVAAIPLGIYLDRRRKARRRAAQQPPGAADVGCRPPPGR